MKDFLAISFALDYDRHGGSPQKSQTEIGVLRALAKPYRDSAATALTTRAADKLVEHCIAHSSALGTPSFHARSGNPDQEARRYQRF